uniref:Uncharacterized protein n=1 Tax=Eutreptiella gymnastica TaxID=73025 RepID=A0A7S1N8J8_9EUGL
MRQFQVHELRVGDVRVHDTNACDPDLGKAHWRALLPPGVHLRQWVQDVFDHGMSLQDPHDGDLPGHSRGEEGDGEVQPGQDALDEAPQGRAVGVDADERPLPHGCGPKLGPVPSLGPIASGRGTVLNVRKSASPFHCPVRKEDRDGVDDGNGLDTAPGGIGAGVDVVVEEVRHGPLHAALEAAAHSGVLGPDRDVGVQALTVHAWTRELAG